MQRCTVGLSSLALFSLSFLLSLPCFSSGCGRSATESVDLRILDWKETQALVASRKGKVVVVDVWSTSCAPCIRELPRLVELHKKHGGSRLSCITVSCDYLGLEDEPPEVLRDPVLAVLRKVGATFDNVLLSVPADEFFQEIDLASIPAVYVYGADGTLVRRFDNDSGRYGDAGFRYAKDIVPLLEKLLARGEG